MLIYFMDTAAGMLHNVMQLQCATQGTMPSVTIAGIIKTIVSVNEHLIGGCLFCGYFLPGLPEFFSFFYTCKQYI